MWGKTFASMSVQESCGNWPKMRKNPGKTRVLQRRGQEPNNLQIPWEKPGFQNEAAQNPTRAQSHLQVLKMYPEKKCGFPVLPNEPP
jgi:hypothetical protein